MEQIKKITRETVIPIGFVIVILSVIVMGTAYVTRIDTRVQMNTGRVQAVELDIKDNPNRNEFNVMKEDILEIKEDIKTLLMRR